MVVKNHMVKRTSLCFYLFLCNHTLTFGVNQRGPSRKYTTKLLFQEALDRAMTPRSWSRFFQIARPTWCLGLSLKPWTMWDDNILLGGWIMPNHVFESLVDEYRNFGNTSFSNNITRVLMPLRWIWFGMLFQHVIMAIKGLACDPWSDSSSIQNKLLQNRSLAMAWTIFSLIRWHFLPHLLDSLAASSRPPLPSMLFTLYTQRVHYWIFWRYFRANIFKFQIHHTINMHIYN